MIGPRVKLIYKDGKKGRAELYKRPDELRVNVDKDGRVGHNLRFVRTGPDEYTEVDTEVESEG